MKIVEEIAELERLRSDNATLKAALEFIEAHWEMSNDDLREIARKALTKWNRKSE